MSKSKNGSLSFWMPARVIAISFAAVIFFGTLLLMLPFCTSSGESAGLLTALFTATTATCVTGLVVVDTATFWSPFGQCVILVLIQLGGLGLVTFTTFFNLLMRKKLGLRTRALAQEAVGGDSFDNVTFLVRMVIAFSLVIELLGAALLSVAFVPKYGLRGIYYSVFLSVSAFCNAGLDPLGIEAPYISLCNYFSSPLVMLTIMGLIVIGGMGFMVWSDIFTTRDKRSLSLHSRVALIFTFLLILAGGLGVLLLEYHNPATIGSMSFADKLLNSLFQSITARTAGFNTIDITALFGTTKLFVCFLMFIGACPGSTGGGIKVTTLAVIVTTVLCVVRGREDTVLFGHSVNKGAVYKALSIFIISLLTVGLCCVVMLLSLDISPALASDLDIFFEAVSAFSTCGLSSGVTALANVPSKLILILTMYVGRVGPVSFALSLAMRPAKQKNVILPEGKILVG